MNPAMAARLIAIAAAVLAVVLTNPAWARIAADTPLSEVSTVNELIASHPGEDVSLILIHGIGVADRTTWDGFRGLICAHLKGQCLSATPDGPVTDRLMLADHAPDGNFLGHPVWPPDEPAAWMGSQPFIDHYRLRLTSGRLLTIHEINWWPLAFAFKCQFIVKDDTTLVGPSKANISACASSTDMHFPWFDNATAAKLGDERPISGGAPLVNGLLKTNVLDWGISDAVLAEGNLKGLLRETVRCAFSNVNGFEPLRFGPAGGQTSAPSLPTVYPCPTGKEGPHVYDAAPRGQFVIISHSLGAFILMDTFAAAAADAAPRAVAARVAGQPPAALDSCEAAAATASIGSNAAPRSDEQGDDRALGQRSRALCAILAQSNRLYFFANQFALMEMGRAQGLADFARRDDSATEPWDALSLWAAPGTPGGRDRQIVAFSDPGDILTFKAPCIRGAKVINIYTHNAWNWLGAFEWPPAAHDRYLISDDVLSIVFGYPVKRATVRLSECRFAG